MRRATLPRKHIHTVTLQWYAGTEVFYFLLHTKTCLHFFQQSVRRLEMNPSILFPGSLLTVHPEQHRTWLQSSITTRTSPNLVVELPGQAQNTSIPQQQERGRVQMKLIFVRHVLALRRYCATYLLERYLFRSQKSS